MALAIAPSGAQASSQGFENRNLRVPSFPERQQGLFMRAKIFLIADGLTNFPVIY
jgi:hypothetical protein